MKKKKIQDEKKKGRKQAERKLGAEKKSRPR